MTRSLSDVAAAALQRCTAEGACADPVTVEQRGGPATGLPGQAASEVAWTGYADAEVDENGELRVRPAAELPTWLLRQAEYRAASERLPDSIAAFTATLASLRLAWAARSLTALTAELEPGATLPTPGFGAALARARAGLIAAGVTVDSRALVVESPDSHPPLPRWTLRCDRPGCNAELHATGATDSDARRTVTLAAEEAGWQISRWRDVPIDLCPEHREEGWAEGPPRVALASGITDGRRKR